MEICYIIFDIYLFLFIYLLSILKRKDEIWGEIIATAISILHWKFTPCGKTEKFKYRFVQKGSMTR